MNKTTYKWYDWLEARLDTISKLKRDVQSNENISNSDITDELRKLTAELVTAKRQALWEAHDGDRWQVEGYIGQFEEEVDRDEGISHHFNYFYLGCPNHDTKRKWSYDYKKVHYHPFNDISSYLDQNEGEYVRVIIEKIPIEQRTCTSCDKRFKCYTERT